jgi:predicted ester cyclase
VVGGETSIKVVFNFANTIPDLKFDNKEVFVAGDRVVARGRGDGHARAPRFGPPDCCVRRVRRWG